MNVIAFNEFLLMSFGNFLRYHIFCGSATLKKYLSTYKNILPATVPKQNIVDCQELNLRWAFIGLF